MARGLGKLFCTAAIFSAALVGSLQGEDWPGWRGPDRTDISTESNLLKQWPADGPRMIWTFDNAGVGYSGPAIVDGRLFTMGTRDDQTILLALDANTGDELWVTTVGQVFDNRWGNGPRSTPTVVGEFIYSLTGEGDIVCLKIDGGERVWQRNMTEFGGKVPSWGYSESLLVDDNHVICTPGGKDGTMVSLDAATGNLVWQSDGVTEFAHYSSPIIVTHEGQKQYAQLTKNLLFGVRSESGEVLWQVDWDGRIAVIPTPIYHDGSVYVTAGYGVGCKLISLKGSEPEEVYANKVMKNHHGGVILVGDYLYGFSDNSGWICQDFRDGKQVWGEKDELDKGAIGYADGQLYCVAEKDGQVVLIDATPEGWNERGRFTLSPQTKLRKPAGRIWTHPVISNRKLYLRDQDLIYCFDVAG